MLDAIHEMVGEWPRKDELDATLDKKRESGEEGGNASGVNGEAGEGGGEVQDRKAIELST